MTETLDIHAASPEEVIAAHENVHEIWSKGLGLDDHVQFRLNSLPHRRATWFVGCVDGQVAVSLGAYPVEFLIHGKEVSGFAIGSVYTRPEFRGRSYAPQLIEWVEDYLAARGSRLSILYSDIPQEYYAALGYQLCPAPCGWRYVAGETDTQASSSLQEFDEEAEFATMSEMYHAYHGATAFSIRRSDDYWRAMSSKFPHDRFFWLNDNGGGHRAYGRLTPDPHGWRILDYACADQDDATLRDLYLALIALAATWKVDRIGGWVPNNSVADELFQVADRSTEVTMIKPLDPALEIDEDIIAAAGRFCEMDHV